MKKFISLLLLFVFFFAQCVPVYAIDMASEFLCEVGIKQYKDGRFFDALHELKKALLVNPRNEEARRYIVLIRRKMFPLETHLEMIRPSLSKKVVKKRSSLIVPQELDKMESAFVRPLLVAKEARLTKEVAVEKLMKAVSVPLEKIPAEKVVRESVVREILDQMGFEKKKTAMGKAAAAYLDKAERERTEKAGEPAAGQGESLALPATKVFPEAKPGQDVKPQKGAKGVKPQELTLEEAASLKFPIGIETGKSITIKGKVLRRFLVTQPENLGVEKISTSEILVTGKNLGYTYLHVWEDDIRQTLEFLTTAPRAAGPTLEEESLSAEELAKNFKLRYSMDWMSFETGRGLASLKQLSSTFSHLFYLNGETPYGRLDSMLALSAQRNSTQATYYSVGLERGKLGVFKDFSLRAFDFTPGLYNLSFSAGNLRGVRFESPAFNHKFDYLLFWGREGGSRYAGFSPGLSLPDDSFLSGVNLNFKPDGKQSHNISVFRGWGPDRQPDLRFVGYDVNGVFSFDPWGLGYDVACDSHTYAYRLNSNYLVPKVSLFTEMRDIRKDFHSSSGLGSNAGELGLLNNLLYKPTDKLELSGRLDVYQDRLFPNPDAPSYWNQDYNSSLNYHFDPLTRLGVDYAFQNLLGRVSLTRTYSGGVGFYKTLDWIRKINTYVRYNHNINRSFNASSASYRSHRVYSGLRFDVIKDIHYYFNQEYDWVMPLEGGGLGAPRAFENGLSWSKRIVDSAYYGELRLTYRNEENTVSPFSFLSGEDYVEYYGSISYRPRSDFEVYFNSRARNVWAENPRATKRIDVDLNAGLRYLWDTGFRFETIGNIDGYVFKDMNADGLKEKDEQPLEGIKVSAGKKTQVTDKSGYYKFSKVRAAKIAVTLDSSSIPSGYTLTVPASQMVTITQGKSERVDFGVAIRTEITGSVFEDVEGSGKWSSASLGIQGVVLTLEDGTTTTTDDYGRFVFKNLSVGKHKVTLDLKTLPVIYIPTVPIFKEIELKEGMSYVFPIPLKKIK